MRNLLMFLAFLSLCLQGVSAEVFTNEGTFSYSIQGQKGTHTGLKVGSNCRVNYLFSLPQKVLDLIKANPQKGLDLLFRYSDGLEEGEGKSYDWSSVISSYKLVDLMPVDYKTLTCAGSPFIYPPIILPILNYEDFQGILRSHMASNRVDLFEKMLERIYDDFSHFNPDLKVGNSFGTLLEIFEMSQQMGFEYISSEELITILTAFRPIFVKEFKGEKEFKIVLSLLREIDILKFSRDKKGKITLSVVTKNDAELLIDAHTFPIKDKKTQEQVKKMFSFIKVRPNATVKLYRDKKGALKAKFKGFIARVRVPFIGMKVNVHLDTGTSYLHSSSKSDYSSKFKIKIKKGIVGIPYTKKFRY